MRRPIHSIWLSQRDRFREKETPNLTMGVRSGPDDNQGASARELFLALNRPGTPVFINGHKHKLTLCDLDRVAVMLGVDPNLHQDAD